jgi:thiol:disulfide interchange protein DsbG
MRRSRRVAVSWAVTCALLLAGVPTARAADAAAAQTGASAGYAPLFARLEQADAVHEGPVAAKHVLYVLFDANCLYCRLTWIALRPYVAAGLAVRWVPVAYQQESSSGRAAAIMLAADRRAALAANEVGYDASRFDGGIEPLDEVPVALAARLRANTQLMREFRAPGTPVLVWKDLDGTVHVHVGMPRLSQLPRITRLPAQPENDPALKAFR